MLCQWNWLRCTACRRAEPDTCALPHTAVQPPGGEAVVQPGPPPSSEGSHQRCFESMLICTHGLNTTRWPLHAYGRHIVRAYKHLLPPEAAAVAASASAAVQQGSAGGGASGGSSSSNAGDGRGSSADGAGESGGAASSSSSSGGAATVLNVVFQRRPGETRQMLNLEELLERCNAWTHSTAAGRRFAASCRAVSVLPGGMSNRCQQAAAWAGEAWCRSSAVQRMPASRHLPSCVAHNPPPPPPAGAQDEITDLTSGMAAAQLADVFVGMHGALRLVLVCS